MYSNQATLQRLDKKCKKLDIEIDTFEQRMIKSMESIREKMKVALEDNFPDKYVIN